VSAKVGKKPQAQREIERMFDWAAMRRSPHYKKGGEAWLRSMKKRLTRGMENARLLIALKTKIPSRTALRARPQKPAR
jgi:hypothetical protein